MLDRSEHFAAPAGRAGQRHEPEDAGIGDVVGHLELAVAPWPRAGQIDDDFTRGIERERIHGERAVRGTRLNRATRGRDRAGSAITAKRGAIQHHLDSLPHVTAGFRYELGAGRHVQFRWIPRHDLPAIP